MAREPDYTKQAAKQSLWDLDGKHEDKRYRKKGRNMHKKLIKDLLNELPWDDDLEKRIEEALDCYYHGPCERCLKDG